MRSERTRRLLVSALAAVVAAPLVASPAAADQGVARDIADACTFAPTSGFDDRPTEGFGDAVDCVAFYRITTGTTPTTFSPGEAVTRGQMASFVVRTGEVAGLSLPEPAQGAFADDDTSVHEDAIDRLAASGVASGFTDGTFRPTDQVSRGQMASFIARELVLLTGAPLPEPSASYFTDDDSTTHERAIDELAEIGVVAGTTSGGFEPLAPVTRGQLALFLARSLDWLTESRSTPLARIGVADATASPELVSAAATTSGGTTTVAFAFDEEVAATSIVAEGFRLIGFDAEATSATSAVRDVDAPNLVRATFPAASARLATTATVARNAVQDPLGNLGPDGAAPLQAVDLLAGTTSAPDLVSVSRLGQSAVDFGFDEPASVVDPTGYHLILADGVVKDSTGLAGGDGTTKHTVAFPLSAEEATQVVRGYVDTATVSDTPQEAPADPALPDAPEGNVNPQQAVAISTSGALSGVPDLLTIDIDAEVDQVRYTFDEAVVIAPTGTPVPGEAPWRVYDLDGAEVSSGSAEVVPGDNRAVVVTFAEGSVASITAGASVDAGAVTSAATEATNRVDEEGFARSLAAGETAAPDLVRVGRVQQPGGTALVPTTVRRIVFEYDQRATLRLTTGFSVYDAEGVRTELAGCEVTGGRFVTCTADEVGDPEQFAAIGDASLAGSRHGAVTDASETFGSYAASGVV